MQIIEYLIKNVRAAARYNPDYQVAPACILWPDRDRQWEAIIPLLRAELPELLVLGSYSPEERTGPAIWLRCAIAGKAEGVDLPPGTTPIIYLPGISRQDLRAVEECPPLLKPIVELQYRGRIWSQTNNKDWTIFAFLASDLGGLGLDVAPDTGTKNAIQLALYPLLDEEVDSLQGKHLDKDFFNTLLTGGDHSRDILRWLDEGDAFREERDENTWRAFVEVCNSHFAFNPETDGLLSGAEKLAVHEGPWRPVWERYCEAPKRYPTIPEKIRSCRPPRGTLSWLSFGPTTEGWPQWNKEQENTLRSALAALEDVPPHTARDKILDLEKIHGTRRTLVWADLGEAPLAQALEHLAVLAKTTANALAAGTAGEMAAAYRTGGWQADDAMVHALATVTNQEDSDAVCTAIRTVYPSWAEDSARHLQKEVETEGYPGGAASTPAPSFKDGECVLFVDGLRYDCAQRLAARLSEQGYAIETKTQWAALPSITETGKPAVSPVRDLIRGGETNKDFEPSVAETGQPLNGNYHLRKLLAEAGWEVLDPSSNGTGTGKAWCESGNIDHEGHNNGWKLARRLDGILAEIAGRVSSLLSAGWEKVHIVTDHGWLLLPGGLPKTELPTALAETKWRRCALIKPGARTDERLYPWYWNPHQHVALADGISCYRAGEEYTHGGLSLQECLTMEIVVSSPAQSSANLAITDIGWKGLRCTIAVEGDHSGLSADLRTHPGNPSSSVAITTKPLKDDGTASLVVEDGDLEGTSAYIVLLAPDGTLVAQVKTTIGGENA